MKAYGAPKENITICDTKGVIYKGRKEGMNQWKTAHAIDTKKRTLASAMKDADVFMGLSIKGAVSKKMVQSMADKPIIFAMANPDPEITPEDVKSVRDDAIIATGRSDYSNQVNNVMGFPYIFRGALDVKASVINDEMKIAAARALASLAREHVPNEVSAAYSGKKMHYGPEYIIPVPFDPRLINTIPPAVANAAMVSGVAKEPINDIVAYRQQLSARLDPTVTNMNLIFKKISESPKNVIFSEGEEENIIKAAVNWHNDGYGTPILVGREDKILAKMKEMSIKDKKSVKIVNAKNSKKLDIYINYLYTKLQRQGFLYRDCVRMVKNERNIFAACMLACDDGDALVTGLTRSYMISFEEVKKVISNKKDQLVFGISMLIASGKTLFIADTSIHEMPTAEELADIAIQTAAKARQIGHEPRVALLSFTNFGDPSKSGKPARIREAVAILDKKKS